MRKLFVLLTLIAAVLLVSGELLMWFARPHFQLNRDGFHQIDVGRTPQQVEAILGPPRVIVIAQEPIDVGLTERFWDAPEGTICVRVEHGKVVNKELQESDHTLRR
jgi:hypothetical protein